MTTTDTTCWTPTPRRLAPQDLPSWATPTHIAAIGEDYQSLNEALFDAHTQGGWDQPHAVYGVLTADQLRTVAPTLALHVPGALMAVRLPSADVPRRHNLHHLLACLDLTGWHGAMVVVEGWATSAGQVRTETRMLQYATAAGDDGFAMRRRTRHGESPTEYVAGCAGAVGDLLRAAVGRRFRTPLPTLVAHGLVSDYLTRGLAGHDDLTDPTLTDAEVVHRLGFSDGMPTCLVDALYPTLAGTVGEIVPSVPEDGPDIAVTPDLVEWLGMDFFRLGAAQFTDRDFLVRATWAVLEVANPDSETGTSVRRRLARFDQEFSATNDDSIAAGFVADPAFAAGLVASLLLAPGGHLWVSVGSQPGESPAMRKLLRALRTLFKSCDPTSPDLPLLAHRIGVLADAADGKLPTSETLAVRS